MLNFIGPMKKHLPDYKKMTSDKEINVLPIPSEVAIPLSFGNSLVECVVEIGQTLRVGDLLGYSKTPFYVPFFASISGIVKAIEKRPGVDMKPVMHVVIESNGEDVFLDTPALELDSANRDELISFMKEKGIVGCGGAGFPAYVKYQLDCCDTLIINAVECEPYITADDVGIFRWSEYFIHGLKAALKIANPKQCLIAVKKEKEKLISFLENATKDLEKVSIYQVENAYPMGWERTLVYTILGKRFNRLPSEVGVITSNATTILSFGRTLKTGLPIYEKIITVSGDGILLPQNLLVRVGTPVSNLIQECGGYSEEKVRLIIGGPMMGHAINKESITLSVPQNAVTVLRNKEEKEMPCLRCGRCIEHCPAGLMPVNIMNATKTNNVDRMLLLHTTDCIECGLCTYVCPSKISVTDHMRRAKKLLSLRAKK